MKKFSVVALGVACCFSASSFAAATAGDSSNGTATFSGWVSGFTSDSSLIVTGSGGNQSPEMFKAELEVSEDGTFISKTAIVLEAHEQDLSTPATPVIGALNDKTKWIVEQVRLGGDLDAKAIDDITNSIVIEDVISATNIDASAGVIANKELVASAPIVHLKVRNDTATTNALAVGSAVSVGVDMVATSL
ncbi:hypothetical protein [Vibrio campbellii]|uniref:hypothetical protein n=1 Tax=Vibrio campbellii TaxID=680 RepID=UPI0006823522|nr:hypothetical protein [Vibrio campbellii]